jgi:nucleotide-binding universal stress UspA family protein
MYSLIVVPLDGSAFGKRALPAALALARCHSAPVQLVHVHEHLAEETPGSYAGVGQGYDPGLYEELRKAMRTELIALAAQLTRETSLPVDAVFLDGAVVPTLEQYLAARHGLVVMMTHGRGGINRAWLGSVADGLIRHASVPILLVRSGAEWPGDLMAPLFRRVLVPLDGSAMGDEVLDHAASLGTSDATVYALLTIVRPVLVPEYPPPVAAAVAGPIDVELQRAEALAHLTTVVEGLRQRGVARVETHVVVNPRVAEGILEEAEAQQADLIALATHGRGAVARFFLGRVADKVVRGASVPVLVYRPQSAPAPTAERRNASP